MLKKIVLSSICSVIATACLSSAVQANCFKSPTITVVGHGKIEASPDVVYLNFASSYIDQSSAAAHSAVEEKLSDFVHRLKSLGVEEKDIIAGSISMNPRYDFEEYQNRRVRIFKGYEVTRPLTVKTSDFSKIGEVADMAVSAGITDIRTFDYSITDPSEYLKTARLNAIEDAKSQAELLAKGFNVHLGEACSLSFGTRSMPRPVAAEMMNDAVAFNGSKSASVKYNPDNLSVESDVVAVYRIESENLSSSVFKRDDVKDCNCGK